MVIDRKEERWQKEERVKGVNDVGREKHGDSSDGVQGRARTTRVVG